MTSRGARRRKRERPSWRWPGLELLEVRSPRAGSGPTEAESQIGRQPAD
jgi:hypothetical protein